MNIILMIFIILIGLPLVGLMAGTAYVAVCDWTCRRLGHDLEPDPGDFVLYCRRCHTCVDMRDLIGGAA